MVRKLKDKDSFLDVLFKAAEDDPNLVEGVGILLFETVKGVGQIFHSCAGNVIALGLKKLAKNILQSDNDIDQVYQIVFRLQREILLFETFMNVVTSIYQYA